MKKIIYISIAAITLLFASCNDFLDRQPKSSLAPTTYWKSVQDLKTWQAGMYNGLQAALKGDAMRWGEIRAGIYNPRGTAYDINLLRNGLTSASSGSSWSNLYKVIYRANSAIKHIPTSPIGASDYAPYLADAYAMRALMYFYAIRVWGDVPMITEPMEDVASQQKFYGRTSIMDIKTLMLDDIAKAQELFGTNKPSATDTKYYLNKGAVQALLVDILMWYKEYDKALIAANDLINNYSYSLVTDPVKYSSQFLNPEGSTEMIFNLFWDYTQGNAGIEVATNYASGSNTIKYHPNEIALEKILANKTTDIRVTMIMDTINPGIPIPNFTLENYKLAYKGDFGNAANFMLRCPKYYTWNAGNKAFDYPNNGEDNTKYPIYRLADIILLKAEALTLQSAPDLAGAKALIKDIRNRAGIPATVTDAYLATKTTQDQVLEAIIDERQIELWNEGKAYFDLVRTNKVKKYLDKFLVAVDEDGNATGDTEGFVIGAEPAPNQIGGYGRMLWPLNVDVFRKNPLMKGKQNKPYDE